MFELSNVLLKSIGIYLLVCFGLYKIKHPKMFKPNGEFRTFGLNKEETTTKHKKEKKRTKQKETQITINKKKEIGTFRCLLSQVTYMWDKMGGKITLKNA